MTRDARGVVVHREYLGDVWIVCPERGLVVSPDPEVELVVKPDTFLGPVIRPVGGVRFPVEPQLLRRPDPFLHR